MEAGRAAAAVEVAAVAEAARAGGETVAFAGDAGDGNARGRQRLARVIGRQFEDVAEDDLAIVTARIAIARAARNEAARRRLTTAALDIEVDAGAMSGAFIVVDLTITAAYRRFIRGAAALGFATYAGLFTFAA